MNASLAKRLLSAAAKERRRLQRHLLVGAALREILPGDPIIVGGTAEEFWTPAEYHETDLDVCVPLDRRGEAALIRHGFRKQGRHWVHPRIAVAVEFPDSKIDGDEARVIETSIGDGSARIIGVDDLYLDRVRQATVEERAEDVNFHSALAIAAGRYEEMDWRYIRTRLSDIGRSEPEIGATMKRISSRIDRRIRRQLRPPG